MRRLQFCLAVIAVLALTMGAFAQVQNGQLTGTVSDPSGAAIANAKVSVTSAATGFSVSAITNASGNYTVKEIPVGTYKVTVEAPGFKTVSNTDVTVNAGTIAHVDAKMTMGQQREIVEVTGAVAQVNTEDSKLASVVSSTQINNLPLNGRNVFDLMQLSTGAVNVTGVDFEGGHQTVVNGLREDFNGFLINGVSNKGLSGGVVNTPIQDSVEEFQQLQLNTSAQYGNSAAGSVNLVTKAGTNAFHGSAWEYIRNDALDANQFFLNQQGVKKPALRFNQFGLTFGGPVIKDKLFFFLSLQGDRFKTIGTPQTAIQESPEWRDAVVQADATSGLNSTAALLYNTFTPAVNGTANIFTDCGGTVNNPSHVFASDDYFGGCSDPTAPGGLVAGNYSNVLCLDNGFGGMTTLMHQKMVSIFGVTDQDFADLGTAGCIDKPAAGTPGSWADRVNTAMQRSSTAIFKTQTSTLGNLFNGNEGSLRLDYNWNASNRFYLQYNYLRTTDSFGPCNAACTRGFSNPLRGLFPNGQLSWVHTFSPTILNEARVGYTENNTLITTNHGGVPAVGFADGSAGFGSYNGYPQTFKENIYTYSDMVSISHGNHNMKVGVDFRRNIENSEFNVARPSYYFYDQVFFAADSPYLQLAGVNPGICKPPCGSYNQAPVAQLESNVRHWRNLEMGAYFQDDWKVSKRLTLNLGIRYDLYQRHHEEGDAATTMILGAGNNIVDQLFNANNPNDCANLALAQLAGGCGPGTGGFAPAKSLGQGDHNNWGPRLGFAWDMFGDGKTSLRGGFGVAYEGTLYNPLSNSRWNLPYYSFNQVIGGPEVAGANIVYGPSVCDPNCRQISNVAPTFDGPPTNPFQGTTGAQAAGNLDGWDPSNPNQATLTGIIFPKGVRDPYVYNYYLSFQREILSKTVLQLDYVGTAGHKLFRAEDINRRPGSYLPCFTEEDETVNCISETDNFGRTWTGEGGRLNQNYGRLRAWENVVNSSYNSLQASVKHQMSHGLLFNVNYTYGHSIDNGSTWHSGATTANGAAAGEGFTTDQTLPGLDRGNSIYDIRHRLVLNYVWQLPGQNLKGAMGVIAGGWSLNGIWAFQSGAHFEPYTTAGPKFREADGKTACTEADFDEGACFNIGGDFNLDGGRNDRPNSSRSRVSGITHDQWANGWFANAKPVDVTFSAPCLTCAGNLGRNTFVGPGYWTADMTLSKIFKITERVNMKFEAQGFNVFNRTNFVLATQGGGAHNKNTSANFGQAAGTLNARNMQFGVKLSF